jgi:uncharacterized membrane protein YdjX (TVP38/TMEM64 family)
MPDAASASAPVTAPPPPRTWFTVGPFAITTGRLLLLVLGPALLIGLALGWNQMDTDRIHARAQDLPGWGVFGAIVAAPLLGIPVAMLHVIAGVRFGMSLGLLIVAATTLLHHLIGFGLVKIAPKVFAHHLAGWRARFPRGAHTPLTIFSCLMPGLPYFVQLYLLPVLGVRLSILIKFSVPLHIMRAVISIMIGDMSEDFTWQRITGVVVYYAALTLACTLAFRRIRRELRMPRQPI